MGDYVEGIGAWFERVIYNPVAKLVRFLIAIAILFAIGCIPFAAVKYLFF